MAKETMLEDEPDKKATYGVKKREPAEQGGDGVKVPESFQQEVHSLLKSATSQHMLDYLRSCLSKCESDMLSKEAPEEYTDEDMPKD